MLQKRLDVQLCTSFAATDSYLCKSINIKQQSTRTPPSPRNKTVTLLRRLVADLAPKNGVQTQASTFGS